VDVRAESRHAGGDVARSWRDAQEATVMAAAKKKAKRPGQKVVVREPDGTQHECTRRKGGALACSAPKGGKGAKGKAAHSSLWVYYRGTWTDAMTRALGRGKNEGSGCCTEGYFDASYEFKTRKAADAAAKKIVKLPGVGWVSVSDWDKDVNIIEGSKKTITSRSLPADVRGRVKAGKRLSHIVLG
jgi:hypothetical protein